MNPTSRFTRYFTPDEANALIPEIGARLHGIASRIKRARELTGSFRAGSSTEERRETLDELETVQSEAQRLLDEIQELGVDVKGVEPALVDFPALFNGKEVFLCWKEGEDSVQWWHPVHTGYTGRMPLEQAGTGAWEWCS